MTILKGLLATESAKWIIKTAHDHLTGRAKYCSINACLHLKYADEIADTAPTVSFFCGTHAVEEAVAAFIVSAKTHGYKDLAKAINTRDHRDKTVVAAFAGMLSRHVEEIELHFALHPEKDDLFARFDRGNGAEYHRLKLDLLSYNSELSDPTPDGAVSAFLSEFADVDAMRTAVKRQADLRNHAIYASKHGVPVINPKDLDEALRQNACITLGLLWAAADLAKHRDQNSALIVQLLAAVRRVADTV